MKACGKRVVMVFVIILSLSMISSVYGKEQKTEKYPSKQIEFVIPFSAGGPVDVSARILVAEVEKILGQKMIIINKGAGGATEGQSYAARSKPDGYTIVALTSSVIANTLMKQVDYKVDSFDPIMIYNFDPEVFIVNADSPYKSMKDIIEASKKGPLKFASPGFGVSHHIGAICLEQKTGITFDYVHSNGGAEQVPMIAGGHVPIGMNSWSDVKSMVALGKIRVLGIMSKKRDPRCPEVPTFKEQGIDIVYGPWRGVAVPKGTPSKITHKLEKAFKAAYESKEVQDKFKNAGFPLMYIGAKEVPAFIKSDYEVQKKIIDNMSKK